MGASWASVVTLSNPRHKDHEEVEAGAKMSDDLTERVG
jgi:hypothetical protein